MNNLYFIDTNILMYAVGSAHPLKQPCIAILKRISDGDIRAVTDTEVFQEIAYRYWSQRKWSVAVQVLELYQSLFDDIYPIQKEHLARYYDLLGRHKELSPRDAIHIAVMKHHGIRHIYTADKDFSRVSSLQTHFPSS